MLLQQRMEHFRRVMAPKIHGAWNLHALTREAPLDFFILYASAASLFGSPGQGSYAAANASRSLRRSHERSTSSRFARGALPDAARGDRGGALAARLADAPAHLGGAARAARGMEQHGG